MKMWLLILSSCIVGSLSVPHGKTSSYMTYMKKCGPIMKVNGLSGRFPGAVAHGIHSITLEDIRYYFKPNATEDNHVPTLNYDLSDKQTVLPNAKFYGYDTDFKTIALRHLDQVLRDMDKKDWYLTKYNTLDKLVHTLHMDEVWTRAKVYYNSISTQEIDENLCSCVKDVNNNGVLKVLPFMALKIRYPGITSGKGLKMADGGVSDWDWQGYTYTYYFFNEWSKELQNFDFSGDIVDIKNKAAGVLVDGDKGIKHLNSEKVWATWKSGMKKMVDRDNYELAMFLYCTLKD